MTTEEQMRLIQACRKGNRKAQCALYESYYKAIFNTTLRILGDRDNAEDVMQEAFIAAFQKLDQYDGRAPIGSWLKRIAINLSLDFLRKQKRMPLLTEKLPDVPEETEAESIEFVLLKAELVKERLYQLPDQHRLVLSLSLIEGFSHEEIADILSISYGAVRVRYSRARKVLLESLRRHAFTQLNN